jgi:hypothetical protein
LSRSGWLPLLLLVACGPDEPPAAPAEIMRRGAFGSLRDLVLFERPDAAGGPFFLDRFEVTRGREGAAVPAGDEALPVTGLDLLQARAFAAWRLCRLPRADEWLYAATADGRYEFPWGNLDEASRANTAELGLGEPTLVGTFESGRRGDGPYDLIGNAAEWTESVPPGFFRTDAHLMPDAMLARWQLERAPALSFWLPPGGIAPGVWLVQAMGAQVPRDVVGGDYRSPMWERMRRRYPHDRSPGQGVRLCTDPRSLCLQVALHAAEPAAAELEILQRLLRRQRHQQVLAPAWWRVRAELESWGRAPGPLASVLDAELPR